MLLALMKLISLFYLHKRVVKLPNSLNLHNLEKCCLQAITMSKTYKHYGGLFDLSVFFQRPI